MFYFSFSIPEGNDISDVIFRIFQYMVIFKNLPTEEKIVEKYSFDGTVFM